VVADEQHLGLGVAGLGDERREGPGVGQRGLVDDDQRGLVDDDQLPGPHRPSALLGPEPDRAATLPVPVGAGALFQGMDGVVERDPTSACPVACGLVQPLRRRLARHAQGRAQGVRRRGRGRQRDDGTDVALPDGGQRLEGRGLA